MKVLAYCANGALLLLAIYVVLSGGIRDGKDAVWFVALVLFPILNIYALASGAAGTDLLSLIIERRRLEQQQKIADLKKALRKEA